MLIAGLLAAALVQLPGSDGCLSSDPSRPPADCAPIRAFAPPSSFTPEPTGDGRHVYLATETGIAAFERDTGSGALRQLDGPAGCLKGTPHPDCGLLEADRFQDADFLDLDIAPGDRHLYASLRGTGPRRQTFAIVVGYRRDPATGSLSPMSGPSGCLRGYQDPNCARLRGLAAGPELAISPDGRHIYATAGRTVAILTRDRATGSISQARGPQGCISGRTTRRCTHVSAPFRVSGLSLSPDGRHAYAAAASSCGSCRPGAVLAFSRDRTSGMLTPLPGRARCVRAGGGGRCDAGHGMTRPNWTTVSPDGRNVYVTAYWRVAAYRRHEKTGALRPIGRNVWFRRTYTTGGLTIGPGGTSAFLGSGGGIAVLRRTHRGRLIRTGCINRRRYVPCPHARISFSPYTVRLSPDGRHAYVGGPHVVGVFSVGP